jgi:alpha-N-acetylglucosamine transferase
MMCSAFYTSWAFCLFWFHLNCLIDLTILVCFTPTFFSEVSIVLIFIFFCFPVAYLDADTIVVKSIEDIFNCGKFCANLKHSERMNSGVMVVEPSETLFNDMMDKVNSLPSYTGG